MKINRDTLKQSHHDEIDSLLFVINLIVEASKSQDQDSFWRGNMNRLRCICERKIVDIIQSALQAQEQKTSPKV